MSANSVPSATALSDAVHPRVFEYDGAYWCFVCKSQWGALPGTPAMPSVCNPPPPPPDPHSDCHERERRLREYVTHKLGCMALIPCPRMSYACNCGFAELLAAKEGV